MPEIFITNTIDNKSAVENNTWEDIQDAAAKHRRSKITVENYSEAKEWSEQQRKWWKGILLPALAADTGDSITYWEAVLKLAVMPDEFPPIKTSVDGRDIIHLPSITTLGMKKMNTMVKGSVAHLRDEIIYGDKFLWVTEPRKELRT